MSDLDARLLAAHAADDRRALVELYSEAANQAVDHEAACFYLTHAYIFALELGHPKAPELKQRLIEAGRESV